MIKQHILCEKLHGTASYDSNGKENTYDTEIA